MYILLITEHNADVSHKSMMHKIVEEKCNYSQLRTKWCNLFTL